MSICSKPEKPTVRTNYTALGLFEVSEAFPSSRAVSCVCGHRVIIRNVHLTTFEVGSQASEWCHLQRLHIQATKVQNHHGCHVILYHLTVITDRFSVSRQKSANISMMINLKQILLECYTSNIPLKVKRAIVFNADVCNHVDWMLMNSISLIFTSLFMNYNFLLQCPHHWAYISSCSIISLSHKAV